mmetsp:Transcript_1851/g.5192  ORF Transcript_1851/g.5192 Transcript_1851/m.5192 type:complete len:339 (-) Transcript_1851:575-1591(-)
MGVSPGPRGRARAVGARRGSVDGLQSRWPAFPAGRGCYQSGEVPRAPCARPRVQPPRGAAALPPPRARPGRPCTRRGRRGRHLTPSGAGPSCRCRTVHMVFARVHARAHAHRAPRRGAGLRGHRPGWGQQPSQRGQGRLSRRRRRGRPGVHARGAGLGGEGGARACGPPACLLHRSFAGGSLLQHGGGAHGPRLCRGGARGRPALPPAPSAPGRARARPSRHGGRHKSLLGRRASVLGLKCAGRGGQVGGPQRLPGAGGCVLGPRAHLRGERDGLRALRQRHRCHPLCGGGRQAHVAGGGGARRWPRCTGHARAGRDDRGARLFRASRAACGLVGTPV